MWALTSAAASLWLVAAPAASAVELRGQAPPAASAVELRWQAPPECPQAAAVEGWLAEHLGARARAEGPRIAAEGALRRRPAGWRLHLAIRQGGVVGERVVDGASCEELARSGALMLAIAVDPGLGGAGVDPGAGATAREEPVGEGGGEDPGGPGAADGGLGGPGTVGAGEIEGLDPPRAAAGGEIEGPGPGAADGEVEDLDDPGPIDGADLEAQGDAEAPPEVDPTTRRPIPFGHALRVAAGLESGLLPGLGGGVLVAYGLRLRTIRFEVAGAFWPARAQAAEGAPGVGARARLGSATVRACPMARIRAPRGAGAGARGLIELPLCVGVEIGALTVRGHGYEGAPTSRAPWLAAEILPGIVWRPGRRIAVAAAFGVALPVTRWAYSIEPLPELFRVGAAGLRVGLGVEVHLGRAEKF